MKKTVLTATEREQEILTIAEALARRGFYVFGLKPNPPAVIGPVEAKAAPRDAAH